MTNGETPSQEHGPLEFLASARAQLAQAARALGAEEVRDFARPRPGARRLLADLHEGAGALLRELEGIDGEALSQESVRRLEEADGRLETLQGRLGAPELVAEVRQDPPASRALGGVFASLDGAREALRSCRVACHATHLGAQVEMERDFGTGLSAERSAVAVREIVDSLAHELRNPLTVVADNLNLIGRFVEKGKPVPPDLVVQAQRGLEHARERLAGLERFALATSDKMPVDLHALLEDLFRTYDRKITREGFVVDRSFDPSLPDLRGAPALLTDLFRNLLDNALQFSRPESKRIEVRTRRDGPWAEVTFKDFGQGIPEALRERVFEHRFTTRELSGIHGVGLSVVRKIVQDHGGSLALESREGESTTFTVRLPLPGGTGET